MYPSDALQCVISTTKPVLVHIVRLCFDHQDPFVPTDPSSEPASKMIITCINAATHSLNIMSALHEQSLLGKSFLILNPDLKLTLYRNVHVFGP